MKILIDMNLSPQWIVFTHDLDFGMLLALTHADGPSVFQIRTEDVLPAALEGAVLTVLRQQQTLLESGALIVIDERASRVRMLPLTRP